MGVTYSVLGEYAVCLEVAPCWGYMNNNQTVRNITTELSLQLNNVYKKIVKEEIGYKNFKLAFKEFPLPEVEQRWKARGKALSDFVEPMDGFHPSQDAQSEMADVIWEWLETNYAEALGRINFNNDLIEKLFGDQGGH
jgi:acyloxyacyl hydrolase